jgi:Trk K+ transport system NAD-binding subunit
VLFVFLLVSSSLYSLANRESLIDGFYHTVSVMSSGVDANPTDPFMRWYVSCLRIAGPALIAAFTAIFTNYLVRARLGGVLELRRIPDAGHVVVCGLGNVGFRVTEELLRAGQSVVVIDPAQDGRFHATARRLGAAVVPGDATVLQVLRSARADSAQAVIAATDNDLSNVEIALLARELQAGQRIVVRLGDPALAAMLRDSANVQLAFSLPAMAAPAFVAALYGDRVQSVFLVGGRLIAAVEIAVAAGEACLDGEPLRAVAVDFGLLPVAVTTADGRAVDDIWSHRLAPGERLTALALLADLDRLYRRERPAPDWAVEIDAFPLSAREALPVMLQTLAGLSAAEAHARLERLPCEVRAGLTPGQAEDLLALLRRDRVTARVSRRCGAAGR